jgi:general secretion pathway protein D
MAAEAHQDRLLRPGFRIRFLPLAVACFLVAAGPFPGPVASAADRVGVAPENSVNFNFDQVDVRTFVKVIGELSGRRFVVDEAVKGQITVMAPRVPVAEAYPLFLKILESVGCAVVEDGNVSRVVTLAPRAIPAAPVVGSSSNLPAGGLVTRVIRLQHISVTDLRKVLDALTGRDKGGMVGILESSNLLIVTDTADNVRRLEQLIAEIDKAGVGATSEVVYLKHVDAADFVQQYNAAAVARDRVSVREGVAARAGKDMVILSSSQANCLVLIGPSGEIAEVKRILALMDVESPSGRGNLHVIFLKYIAADEASKSLNALMDKSLGKEPVKSGEKRRMSIEASAVNNALLVEASPMDFQVVRSLVEELDRSPQQVLIEVVIAEISADQGLDAGVEMAALNLPSKVGDTVVQGASLMTGGADSLLNSIQSGVFPRGITVGVAQGTRLNANGEVVSGFPAAVNVNALQTKGKVRILSSVPLLSQNNKEASVSVVNNIPVLKSTIQGGSGTSRDVIQNIDRVDVGIKLKLTPHVNPSNEVCMVLNPSIEALLDTGSASGTAFTPTIARREVSTTVTVPDGRTIVISGLIREDRIQRVRKIPILGSIPLLGILFRHTVDSVERTNLIVFVTPHVMADAGAVQQATDNWSRKTGLSATNVNEAAEGLPPAAKR